MQIGGRREGGQQRSSRRSGFRRLRLESLERRQLLAGDLAGGASLQCSATDSAAVFSQSFSASTAPDAAGNTLSMAADLGRVDGMKSYQGKLDRTDRIDLVRLHIDGPSSVRFSIDQLNQNADLHILDSQGRVIGSSTRAGTREEIVSGTLSGGDYFLAITAETSQATRYRLNLDSRSNAAPAIPPLHSATPESAPETPSPAPAPGRELAIRPLAEVETFGGRYDWNLNAVGAPEAWAAGYSGQGVTVAVVDTGVDLNHPDLINQFFINAAEIPGNGIDDDLNGYVDDVRGYDFVSGDPIADDGNGHGTHVAGIVAASHDGMGATGVAPDARILPVRVLDDSGRGSDADVAKGIRYAADMGAHIINLSLGGTFSTVIANAVTYATSLGSLIIAAAGNESASTPAYPAGHSAASAAVLSVGAFDANGISASFSNQVGTSSAVQIDAPGSRIYSTYRNGQYALLSGTSMASPHVAGVAALTLSANPDLTSVQLRELLSSGTDGIATGSDSMGKASTLQTVAYAAAGRTVIAATSTPGTTTPELPKSGPLASGAEAVTVHVTVNMPPKIAWATPSNRGTVLANAFDTRQPDRLDEAKSTPRIKPPLIHMAKRVVPSVNVDSDQSRLKGQRHFGETRDSGESESATTDALDRFFASIDSVPTSAVRLRA